MIALAIAATGFAAWAYLLLLRDGFWRANQQDRESVTAPAAWPRVTAVVPARDEADVIARAIGSLAAQDYPGDFRILLVDDGSSDGTADIARGAGGDRLTVLTGRPLAAGWTGKLWAMSQGVEAAGGADIARGAGGDLIWFTDADIVHAPDTLAMLVARLVRDRLTLHSLMAELRCDSAAEKALVPAFVFFFQMLYPFAAVNDPARREAGAAGGCMLVDAQALERAGGVAAIAASLIDDCAMGRALKRQGAIRLALTHRSRSIRPYGGAREIGAMIARSAYAQLHYSPLLLAGTLLGMGLLYLAPPLLALFGDGPARWLGLADPVRLLGFASWAMMAIAFQPMLRFYRRSPLWGPLLPLIGLFYAGATFASALAHWRGKGGMWKGRVQAQVQA